MRMPKAWPVVGVRVERTVRLRRAGEGVENTQASKQQEMLVGRMTDSPVPLHVMSIVYSVIQRRQRLWRN